MAGLTLRQEKFVQALTTPNTPTYCKPTASYRTISPTIVPGAQAVGASRMIRNDKVSQAIRGQLSIPALGSKLKKCLRETEKLKDWGQVRETVMDYAKLTGQLVEKREQVNIDGASSIAIRDLVSRSMRPVSSTLPSASSDADKSVSEVTKCNNDTNSGSDVVANG